MDINELLKLIDSGIVYEVKIYCNGACSRYRLSDGIQTFAPNHKVIRIWNSEDGQGISILIDKGGE